MICDKKKQAVQQKEIPSTFSLYFSMFSTNIYSLAFDLFLLCCFSSSLMYKNINIIEKELLLTPFRVISLVNYLKTTRWFLQVSADKQNQFEQKQISTWSIKHSSNFQILIHKTIKYIYR